MANEMFLTLKGAKQGLISAGCSTLDSIGNLCQNGHADQIYLYELNHSMSREQHVSHHPVVIIKPIDKSSPLIGIAISNNERLDATIDIYRTNQNGGRELFYTIKLTNVTITDINIFYPNSLTHNESQPQESLSLKYESIAWQHHIAGTSGYSIWDDRVY
ncbi:Hcp [Chania multitudinisentens RB-25]|uniref:Hcp n=2 Tax=Chania TaxID=1745211 RepID=W0L918_9GAMM|nr:Hcp family type VI secretion system effector [Chania multitudinisentens]AHG18772.1 Hcp [Chania multitudinisentens RB-25]